ncbi:hypothetical protein SYNPS1DRAFT_26503 [Syncephalis pseudoplumigaleata]|uniref:Uncharacterized protein n=1 Tax=Syncephalis pseudoplumigaleata TaxID=1712513 RepID=A0A4P9Z6R0_9FUNG|nr:hypothetical protein SYNPS1DRAFT_26503 [Syncephalis pseudoplumigaleata]|eukprot:RKP27862.1 hypothetical protein SYNPS1DRAFT_26503 [Syncephalis pseudoplumigaleata]
MPPERLPSGQKRRGGDARAGHWDRAGKTYRGKAERKKAQILHKAAVKKRYHRVLKQYEDDTPEFYKEIFAQVDEEQQQQQQQQRRSKRDHHAMHVDQPADHDADNASSDDDDDHAGEEQRVAPSKEKRQRVPKPNPMRRAQQIMEEQQRKLEELRQDDALLAVPYGTDEDEDEGADETGHGIYMAGDNEQEEEEDKLALPYSSTIIGATERDALLPPDTSRNKITWRSDTTPGDEDDDENEEEEEARTATSVRRWMFYTRTPAPPAAAHTDRGPAGDPFDGYTHGRPRHERDVHGERAAYRADVGDDNPRRLLMRMGQLAQEILARDSVALHLKGAIDLQAHGLRLSDLPFEKTVPVEGLRGLKKMDIEQLDLPRNHPQGGIEMAVTMNIGNPAQTVLHMPALTFAAFYHRMQLSELTTQAWSLAPGDNRVVFTGRMLPQSGANITLMNEFMSSYMAGNTTTIAVRGANNATAGRVAWLDGALERLALQATVPGMPESGRDLIRQISRMDLDLDFTQPHSAYHPPVHGRVLVPLHKLPFGFPLQIDALGLDVDFGHEHASFARLHLPPTPVDMRKVNETTTLLAFNLSHSRLDALSGRARQFEAFMTSMLLQPAVNLSLSGVSTVGMSTAVGALTVSALPVKLTSRLTGMDGFRHAPLTISQLSIVDGTEEMLTLGMHVVMVNPTDIRCRFPWLRLMFGPHANTTIGEVLTSNVDLSPGNTTLVARSSIARPQTAAQRQMLSRFFSNYLTQEEVAVHVQGHPNATGVPSLAPALQQLQLTGRLPGLRNDPLLRHAALHLLWNPAVTLTMYNPIPGINITLWEVEATVMKDNATIGGNHWQFSNNATTGLPPPIVLPPQQEVVADHLPVKASSYGYKIIRDAVNGSMNVDVNITTTVTLGQFPLTMHWLQPNVTVDVHWF